VLTHRKRYRLLESTVRQGQVRAIAASLTLALELDSPIEASGQPPTLNLFVYGDRAASSPDWVSQIDAHLRQTGIASSFRVVQLYRVSTATAAPQWLHTLSFGTSTEGVPATQLSAAMVGVPVPLSAPQAGGSDFREGTGRGGHPPLHLARTESEGFWLQGAIAVAVLCATVGGTITFVRSQPPASLTPAPVSDPPSIALLEGETASSLPPLAPLLDADIPVPQLAEPPSGQLPPGTLPPMPTIPSETGLVGAASMLTVAEPQTVAVRLKAVGDIIPGTNYPDYRLPADPSYLFRSVQPFLGETDILFGNFESTLTDYPYSAKDISRGLTFAFRTPPAFARVLHTAGFDVLSVANNHSFDFAQVGFDDTIAHIEQAGMRAVGRKDDIVTVEVNGLVIAFIGFSYLRDHNFMGDLATATTLVQTADAQADIVVISVHAGAEGTDALAVRDRTEFFVSENRGNMVQFSRAMIEAGADVILGHGPHVPRAIELYQDKLIAYSLGNFVGYRTLSTVGPLGTSLILQIHLDAAGNFVSGRVIPVALDPNGVPYIDNFFQSVTLVRQLTRQDFPNTALEIDEMGYILRTDQ